MMQPDRKQQLLDLAERVERAVERAEASEQRQWLERAFYAANPAPEEYGEPRTPWVEKSNRFRRMLDAEAYESAATLLVPEGHIWTVYSDGVAGVCIPADEDDIADGDTDGATPALALTAASLKALAEQEEG